MQHYLNQLITDIKEAAENLPEKPYYDIPPEAKGIEYVIEWENAVEKPMHEWIGIAKENFLPPENLTDDELDMMVDEIQKLWAAYNFYADLPENLPARITYKLLVDYFDKPVAWISEGMLHIEFCDYEPEKCPFPEEFCKCKDYDDGSNIHGLHTSSENAADIYNLEKEIKEIENKGEAEFLPQKDMERYVEQRKYLEVVKKIAENNNCGYICFFNPDTGEMEEAMPEWLEDPGSHEDVMDQEWEEMYTFEKWERVSTIEPPESDESFRIMEDFAEYKVTDKLQEQLFGALNRQKPFRNFKNLIDQSEYRQEWFDYKQKRLEERAWEIISEDLNDGDVTGNLPF
jgi:hypothetical protein